jgi:ornithine cyclodeaminase/alanine dehydrogenase-like protein (mu-crystallin family)
VISDHRDRLRDQWRGSADTLGPAYDAMVDLPVALGGKPLSRPAGSRGVFLSDGRALEDLAAVSLVLEAARSSGRTGLKLY